MAGESIPTRVGPQGCWIFEGLPATKHELDSFGWHDVEAGDRFTELGVFVASQSAVQLIGDWVEPEVDDALRGCAGCDEPG